MIQSTTINWRNYLSLFITISTNCAVVLALILPKAGHNPVADFKFPKYIKLDSAKTFASAGSTNLVETEPVPLQSIEVQPETIEASQKYTYVSENPISLEINYISNARGDVVSYLHKYTEISPKAIQKAKVSQLKGIGHHILIRDRDRAYLSSCISPRSLSNVDRKQFSQYRYQNDLTLKVGWEWLLGKSSIRDRRCLWVHLSIPLVTNSQNAQTLLESTWKEIYQWWLPKFPPL